MVPQASKSNSSHTQQRTISATHIIMTIHEYILADDGARKHCSPTTGTQQRVSIRPSVKNKRATSYDGHCICECWTVLRGCPSTLPAAASSAGGVMLCGQMTDVKKYVIWTETNNNNVLTFCNMWYVVCVCVCDVRIHSSYANILPRRLITIFMGEESSFQWTPPYMDGEGF